MFLFLVFSTVYTKLECLGNDSKATYINVDVPQQYVNTCRSIGDRVRVVLRKVHVSRDGHPIAFRQVASLNKTSERAEFTALMLYVRGSM